MAPTLVCVSRETLRQKIEGGGEFVLVDALSPMSYAMSHLPGAISMPPEHVDEWAPRRIHDPNTEVVVYCADVTCDSSVIVANRLIELGYRNVRHYAEGKRDWVQAGLPLERVASKTTSVERELAIAASPETVWEFLVDPEKATRWMGQTATFDLRPGGLYRVEVIPGETARGEFVEVDPPHRLAFTWGWEPGGRGKVPPGSTTIEIELVPNGDGTTLRFTHRDLPGAEAAESHAHGWDHYFARLVIAARGDDPGPDPWLTGEM